MSVSPPTLAPNPWLRILDALEKKVNRHSYDTWLKPTRYSHASGGVLFVRVPNREFQQVGDKYGDLIQEALDNLGLEYQDVQFVSDNDPAATPVRHDGGLSRPPVVSQSRFDWDGAAQLNPRYTFDAFVIGSGNQFAHAACQAVAERPSKAYNPLFLYGGVGMGKTHLMQAIGHEIKRQTPQAAICYISSEKFTNEMINSLRYDKMTSFRDKYRNVDVLLIDDIQFLAQKERTQEEFFHTFNALHGQNRQLVLSSDRPPKAMVTLEERLRSRFEWGLTADIQPPDIETRVAILRSKAERAGRTMPPELLELIARKVQSNIRELEGALIRVLALSDLSGVPIGPELVESALADMLPKNRRIAPDTIIETVATQFGIGREKMLGRERSKDVVLPRQITMYLIREETNASLPEIGNALGGRDHTTVMYGIDKINELMEKDDNLRRTIMAIRQQLYQPSINAPV